MPSTKPPPGVWRLRTLAPSGGKAPPAHLLRLPRIGEQMGADRATAGVEDDPATVSMNVDAVVVRVGRVVVELDTLSVGSSQSALDLDLARKLAARARGR